MASYRIVCIRTEYPHRHIVSVGVGGTATAPIQRLTLQQVCDRMAKGHRFYTVSAATGKEIDVRAERCQMLGCNTRTIASKTDGYGDNHLAKLTTCP